LLGRGVVAASTGDLRRFEAREDVYGGLNTGCTGVINPFRKIHEPIDDQIARYCQRSLTLSADSETVRSHLADVLTSQQFASAPRLSRFLTFIVEAALEGKSSEIKESLIAVEVYGRAADYDPRVDSTVRVEAWRLRAKLREFYETAGSDATVRIDLPKGGYVPVFRESVSESQDPAAQPEPAAQHSREYRRSSRLIAAFAMLVLIGCASAVLTLRDFVRAETPDPEVMKLYSRAWELLRHWRIEGGRLLAVEESVRQSITLFQQVVERSPGFARGWASLAEASEFGYELDGNRPKALLTAARTAARRAIELDPRSPEAHAALCSILFFRDWDLAAAESACRRAVDFNPRDVVTHRRLADLRRVQGRWSEAADDLERAISVVPSDPGLRLRKARLYYDAGQYRRAAEETKASLAINIGRQMPSWTLSLWLQGLCHEQSGQTAEAEASYRAALAHDGDDMWNQSALGHLLAKSGRTREAEQIRRDMELRAARGEDQNFALALVHVGFGDHARALAYLERGFARREDTMLFLGLEQRFEPIRGDARFQALLGQIRGRVPARNLRSDLFVMASRLQ
jgi:tetratricopeptide (TPR) repeat protein